MDSNQVSNLKEVLEKIFHMMQRKGMLPNEANKEKIVGNLLEQFKQLNFNPEDLDPKKNPESAKQLQKALILCLANESLVNLKKDESLRIDIKLLFAPKGDKNLAELLKNELKKVLNALNKELEKNKLTPKSAKDIDKIASQLAKFLSDKMKPQPGYKRIAENDESMDLIASLTIGSLMGGVNPKMTGAIPRVVQYVAGNLSGFITQNPGGEEALSFFADLNTATPGKADPTGGEQFAVNNAIANGENFTPILAELEKEFANPTPSPYLNPFSTNLTRH